jgi:hypothetical protein
MPTKKQRRRRAKGKRHEYEFVTFDEEGREVPVDPAELRPERAEKTDAKKSTPKQQPTDRRGRPLRAANPPSWTRAAKRAGIFVVALFVFTSLVGKTKPALATRIAISVAYGAIGVPFFYWMDRAAYRRYLRATGRGDEIPTGRRTSRR